MSRFKNDSKQASVFNLDQFASETLLQLRGTRLFSKQELAKMSSWVYLQALCSGIPTVPLQRIFRILQVPCSSSMLLLSCRHTWWRRRHSRVRDLFSSVNKPTRCTMWYLTTCQKWSQTSLHLSLCLSFSMPSLTIWSASQITLNSSSNSVCACAWIHCVQSLLATSSLPLSRMEQQLWCYLQSWLCPSCL